MLFASSLPVIIAKLEAGAQPFRRMSDIIT
jgi:hypothetical protein